MFPALRAAEERFRPSKPAGVSGGGGKRRWSVSVVTPWRDHPEFAEDYWRAVEAAAPTEVIVVDDASATPIEGAAFRFDEPAGFVRASNKGLELATSDVVVFLNNDVRLVDPHWLDSILALCEPGVLVGEIRNDPHCWVDGMAIPYVDGWCVAGMREDLERLGGFDDAFTEPAYYGDNDLSLRAIASGMRLAAVRIGLRHLVNGTTDDDPAARERASAANRRLYEERVRGLKVAA
jgi:GT2 family glycosyltransferase